MKILLTNDDGIESNLNKNLYNVLKEYGDVFVVCPLKEMSGASTRLNINKPMIIHNLGDQILALENASPADCVSYALGNKIDDFDLIVSGPNNGLNITYDIMHSGTIGACIEANLYHKPAIAFSFEYNEPFNEKWIRDALKFIFEKNLIIKDGILNVNFPSGNINKGIKISHVSHREDNRFYEKDGNVIIPKREINKTEKHDKNSDVYLASHHYTSITPLKASLFDKKNYLALKKR